MILLHRALPSPPPPRRHAERHYTASYGDFHSRLESEPPFQFWFQTLQVARALAQDRHCARPLHLVCLRWRSPIHFSRFTPAPPQADALDLATGPPWKGEGPFVSDCALLRWHQHSSS